MDVDADWKFCNHIRHLRKEVLNEQGEAVAAVDHLDLSMCEGQVRAYSPCVFLWPVPLMLLV
jgi:hypothetical protein